MPEPIRVPNKFPTLTAPYRIAIVGESPGRDEETVGTPFIGASGRLLDGLLSKANILRDACFIGNICQIRPPGNVLPSFDWDGDEIQSGLKQLAADLNQFQPHLILCLGAAPLHAFKEGATAVGKRRGGEPRFAFPNSIDDWRGSRFISSPFYGLQPFKCLASYHPAFCLRTYENTPFLMMDVNRAAKEGLTSKLSLPQRLIEVDLCCEEILRRIAAIRTNRSPISADIEGYYHSMSCISIATSPAISFTIPFSRKNGASYWSEDEEVLITRALSDLLMDPQVPKTWQNGLYDRWVLQYGYNIPVMGNDHDTMLLWWEKYCELPKGLGTQVSVLTDEPFYKSQRKSDDDETFYAYCAKDSAVTMEVKERLLPLVSGVPREHYRFNHDLLNLFLYIELRGVLYDSSLAKQQLKDVQSSINALQSKLDRLCNAGLSRDLSAMELELMVRDTMCYKRDSSKVKAPFLPVFDEAIALANKENKSDSDWGQLSVLLDRSMNIKSAKFKDYLYKTLKLPVQTKKATGSETTDFLAMLKLMKKAPHPVVETAIDLSFLRTRSQMLAIHADPDGRMRCGYNIVGTVTGRITCYTSPTGSGYNLQTLPDTDSTRAPDHPLHRGMRDLIKADLGHWFFQCDLKGSDGWTIGAHLNALGAPTMLNDLKHGIKPASRICYMLRHGIQSLRGKTLDEIRDLLKEVKKDDWDYFACKIGIWGICYLMGPDTLADNLMKESDGKIIMSRKDVADFRTAVFEGYNVGLWHTATQRKLAKSPTLVAACGHVRYFYGRSKEILSEALAHEPQINTTYATNRAAHRLWTDPDNRVADKLVYDSKGRTTRVPFRVEPLHQVHDALLGEFAQDDTPWAVGKINEWFDNPLTIAGQRIIIPFEGNYGPSWGNMEVGKI